LVEIVLLMSRGAMGDGGGEGNGVESGVRVEVAEIGPCARSGSTTGVAAGASEETKSGWTLEAGSTFYPSAREGNMADIAVKMNQSILVPIWCPSSPDSTQSGNKLGAFEIRDLEWTQLSLCPNES
jgi:hypothetical protein